MKRLSLLVAHPWMARGGSEATAMWTLEALQEDYDITFVTAATIDWDSLNRAYGTAVKADRIRLLKAPALPTVDSPLRFSHLQVRYFERYCHRIAGDYDLSLSAYNPLYFGRPAMHLIGDFSFSEEMRKRLYIHGAEKFQHRESLLRKLYLGAGSLLEVKKPPLREWGDLVLANSDWSAAQLSAHFGLDGDGVIYPPVILPTAPAGASRDPLRFVCLGRVVPEKELERIIRILGRVRESGHPVTLQLIGNLDDSDYSRGLAAAIVPHRDWITPTGFLDLEAKQNLIASCTYAIHACRIEAFGIAVAEMVSMGCVPFVPDTGGAGEIVPFPELQFGDDDEAVAKIIAMLESPELTRHYRETLPARMEQFGPGKFMDQLRKVVLEFSRSRNAAC
jgi:glycosyltransferase involved in cell wall biosynthesis